MRNVWPCVFAVVLVGSGAAWGATITVTTTEPGIVEDGLCSLAEAVENANDGDVNSDCAAADEGSNIIELGQGETYYQESGDSYLLSRNVTINGNGSTLEAMNADVGWRGLAFSDDGIINDLTIKDSVTVAIWPLGCCVSLHRCTIRDNTAGVDLTFGTGPLVIVDSVFSSNEYGIVLDTDYGYVDVIAINTAFVSNGVAIFEPDEYPRSRATLIGCTVNDNGSGVVAGAVNLRDSTISNNQSIGVSTSSGSITGCTVSGNGSGVVLWRWYLENQKSEIEIVATTITGNTHAGIWAAEGGLFPQVWDGVAFISDSTVTGNEFGLRGLEEEFKIKNTIIGSNTSNCFWFWETPGNLSGGFNLTDNNHCQLDHVSDVLVGDVMLSELGNHGGPTPTHMPLEGSPAIDMVNWEGPCSQMRTDQRGYRRPADGDGDGVAYCDCGAVEAHAVPYEPPGVPEYPDMPPAHE